MIVVPGSASGALAKSLAHHMAVPLAEVAHRRFPDDEYHLRIGADLSGEDAVLVQTTWPDRNIVEFLLMVDAAREFPVKSLTAVVPYYGYARQDKKFASGEPISSRAIARAITAGVDRLVTVDIHDTLTLKWFDGKMANVSAMGQIAAYLKNYKPGIDVVIAPDDGSMYRAKTVAEALGVEFDFMEKKRIDGHTVEIKPKKLSVSGKNVALVDDIISTGGTIVQSTNVLKAQGAGKVVAACTHGVFAAGALQKLKVTCDLIVSTDTIENETTAITAAVPVAEALKGLY